MTNSQETISVRWENKPKQRYYRVIIQQDLFGSWILLRIWGGIQRKGGGTKVIMIDNFNQGIEILQSILTYRKKRGYNVVSAADNIGKKVVKLT